MRLVLLGIGIASLLGTSLYALLPTSPGNANKLKGESILFTTATNSQFTKVTPHPLHMSQAVAMLCVQTPLNAPSPHVDKYFDVYISSPEAFVIKSGIGTYLEGTVILKRKYSDPDGKKTELFTGMIKRAPGYNPQSGDWEYFTLSGDGAHVEQSGQLQSCMSCHQAYSASDFVTRDYFTHPGDFTTKPFSW
ncbi:MAG TPA: cytochrome P460 family protein [Candidatus Methylacidiphilales bacterium]|jgi:hypothetical protein|nr:cytochrome P460 family protein [Candidatus Methylacidiphilales bacterium]